MFKLLKYFRKIDWLFVFIIFAITFNQVFCTVTLTDCIQKLTDVVKCFTDGLGGAGLYTTKDIWTNALFMLLTATCLVITQIIISILSAYICSSLAKNIRFKLNEKISDFSLNEINKFSVASLVTRTSNDVGQYQMAVLMSLRMLFAAPITAVWAILKIQAVSWKLMLPTLVGIVVLVAFLIFLMLLVLPKFKITQQLLDRLNGVVRENISGIRVVRAYNAEEFQENKFEKVNKKTTDIQMFTGAAMASLTSVITIIMNLISVALYWIGSSMINDPTEKLEFSQILSFMMLSSQIVMSFMMLLMMFVLLPRASISAGRIKEVLETKISIEDPVVEKDRTSVGTIEFKDVSFTYPDSDTPVIEDINFQVKKGETLALIGETGCGKSTVVNLLTRNYDASYGKILVDGVDVKDMKLSTLHHLMSVVPQKGLLFKGDIEFNLKLGNDNLTNEELDEICELSCSKEFIDKLPDKYNSPIAQGGTNVSGGQRQRLCIARALATHPEIIVFDDSFSALDFKTDKQVRENLAKHCKDMTKVIVAQRIGTIMDADHIAVLQEGKIVGYGSHKELLEKCQVYRDIALSQLSKEELGL